VTSIPADTPAKDHQGGESRGPTRPGARPETGSAPGADAGPAVSAGEVSKVYGTGDAAVHALRAVTVSFARGAFTAIMGPSGSGKSTLMHCLAGLDVVSAGSVRLGDVEITKLTDRQLTLLRRERVGFVFQAFNLVPTLTAEQNILLPLELAGRKADREWFDHVVGIFGLRDRLSHRPSELSGGQQQRVACARALVSRPEVIFADEPTGNLDSRSGGEVLGFLRMSVREMGQTTVMVTHDPVAASYADRVVFLHDGAVVAEMYDPTPAGVLDQLKRLGA
jgi:putative ABC transport system ATP-binding protein